MIIALSPTASWALVLTLTTVVVLAIWLLAWRDHHPRASICLPCGARHHGHRPRTTGRMWGHPRAEEPDSIEWCTGRRLVRLPPGWHLNRYGQVTEDPMPELAPSHPAPPYGDEEPF